MRQTRHRSRFASRGTAALAAIIVLILAQIAITALVLGVARDQDTILDRVDGVRAFYAAEAGLNMSVREIINSADEDADGSIGGVSDDGNSANNPTLTGGVSLTSTYVSGTVGSVVSSGAVRSVTHSIQCSVK